MGMGIQGGRGRDSVFRGDLLTSSDAKGLFNDNLDYNSTSQHMLMGPDEEIEPRI